MMKKLFTSSATTFMMTQRGVVGKRPNLLKQALLYQIPRRGIISDFFVQPMLQERQQKRVIAIDTKEIFQRVKEEHETLTYQQSVDMLNDLAYLVIPFDKTHSEFQLLITRLKLLLKNQSGNVKLFALIDSITRLHLDNFNSVIRDKVEEGNYSRSPQDICAILYFFATQHKISHSQRDVELFSQVLKDLRHMEVHSLQIEHMDFLVRAFQYSAEQQFLNQVKDIEAFMKEIEDFLPRLVKQTFNEMMRCNLTDIITLMQSFYKLWDKQIFKKSLPIENVFKNCDAYLSEYLGQSKKDITGSQFASLVELIANSHTSGLHIFGQKVLHNLQHIFLNDNSELYIFSMRDVVKLLRGFESINQYFNRDKVIEGLVNLVQEADVYEDEGFLEVLNECNKRGLIETHLELGAKARIYFEDRFPYMEREAILGYLELFRELGMLFEDQEISGMLLEHLRQTYHLYDLGQLFKVYKLAANNFYRNDPQILQIIEDAVKIRASEAKERELVKPEHARDLIEGLRLHSAYNKRLDSSLRTILKNSHLLLSDKRLFIQYVTYASDFELTQINTDAVLKEKLQSAYEAHQLSLQDKIHLALYAPPGLFPTLDKIEQDTIDVKDFETLDKLVLLGLRKQDSFTPYDEIEKDCNLQEVIQKLLDDRGLKYQARQIVCDERLRAAFVIEESKTIIDLIDNQMAIFTKHGGAAAEKKLRLRGRVAEKLAKEHGYQYKLVSLVEMDFASDEQQYLEDVIFGQEKAVHK